MPDTTQTTEEAPSLSEGPFWTLNTLRVGCGFHAETKQAVYFINFNGTTFGMDEDTIEILLAQIGRTMVHIRANKSTLEPPTDPE